MGKARTRSQRTVTRLSSTVCAESVRQIASSLHASNISRRLRAIQRLERYALRQRFKPRHDDLPQDLAAAGRCRILHSIVLMRALLGTVGSVLLLASCNGTVADAAVSTLYRNSVADASTRIHVASFDSADGASYNRDNCEIASNLFQKPAGGPVTYWCERGYFSRK